MSYQADNTYSRIRNSDMSEVKVQGKVKKTRNEGAKHQSQ